MRAFSAAKLSSKIRTLVSRSYTLTERGIFGRDGTDKRHFFPSLRSRSKVVRLNIARVLTVIRQTQLKSLREAYKDKVGARWGIADARRARFGPCLMS